MFLFARRGAFVISSGQVAELVCKDGRMFLQKGQTHTRWHFAAGLYARILRVCGTICGTRDINSAFSYFVAFGRNVSVNSSIRQLFGRDRITSEHNGRVYKWLLVRRPGEQQVRYDKSRFEAFEKHYVVREAQHHRTWHSRDQSYSVLVFSHNGKIDYDDKGSHRSIVWLKLGKTEMIGLEKSYPCILSRCRFSKHLLSSNVPEMP